MIPPQIARRWAIRQGCVSAIGARSLCRVRVLEGFKTVWPVFGAGHRARPEQHEDIELRARRHVWVRPECVAGTGSDELRRTGVWAGSKNSRPGT